MLIIGYSKLVEYLTVIKIGELSESTHYPTRRMIGVGKLFESQNQAKVLQQAITKFVVSSNSIEILLVFWSAKSKERQQGLPERIRHLFSLFHGAVMFLKHVSCKGLLRTPAMVTLALPKD